MSRYEKHDTDEGKFQCPECDYGHGEGNGKSRQAVSSHHKKTHDETVEKVEETVEDPSLEGDISFSWLDYETPEVDESTTISTTPLAETILRGALANEGELPKSPKALKEFYKQQGKMLRWVFSGFVDPLFAWWGRGVMADPDFEIKRSSSDWELFEDASASWLEYRGLTVPLTPDVVMLGTVASFYAPVVVKVRAKRDPNRKSWFQRWRARRAVRKALKNRGEDEHE